MGKKLLFTALSRFCCLGYKEVNQPGPQDAASEKRPGDEVGSESLRLIYHLG